ncbi:hypothetical protein CB1_002025003 [Camelus ferus]|nr:hypothetical protein CB1_002025003 [Camelus ferus]
MESKDERDEKANGGPRVPRDNLGTLDLKAHWDLKDYKVHRESQEFLETRGQQGKPDLEESRVMLGTLEFLGGPDRKDLEDYRDTLLGRVMFPFLPLTSLHTCISTCPTLVSLTWRTEDALPRTWTTVSVRCSLRPLDGADQAKSKSFRSLGDLLMETHMVFELIPKFGTIHFNTSTLSPPPPPESITHLSTQ